MPMNSDTPPKVVYDKGELRERLTPIEYQVTQEKGTERPYTNMYYKHRSKGIYGCKVCTEPLFASNTKYDSGSGWPSFFDVLDKNKVIFKEDASGIGGNILLLVTRPEMIRTEVSCKKCGSHLGHVFTDGPKPTGQRYCVNSSSLSFVAETTSEGEVVTEEEEAEISCPATLGGCSPDGTCSIRSKEAVRARLEQLSVKESTSVG